MHGDGAGGEGIFEGIFSVARYVSDRLGLSLGNAAGSCTRHKLVYRLIHTKTLSQVFLGPSWSHGPSSSNYRMFLSGLVKRQV